MAKKDRETDPAPDVAKASDKRDPLRVSLPLTDDGQRIDWGSVRDSRRATLIDLIKRDPQFAAVSGGQAAPAGASADVFAPAMAGMVFDMLGSIEVALVMRSMGVSRERAAIMLYTDDEKAILTGPLCKVINKYGSTWLAKWGDELALAGLIVAVHAPKLQALQAEPTRPADVLPFTMPQAAPLKGEPAAESQEGKL